MPTPYIADGLTIHTTIKGRGFVPDLAVSYRPALSARVYQWRRDSQQAKTADADLLNDIKIVVDQLNSLEDLPLEIEAVKTLWPWQLSELVSLVTGYVVPDSQGVTPQSKSEKN